MTATCEGKGHGKDKNERVKLISISQIKTKAAVVGYRLVEKNQDLMNLLSEDFPVDGFVFKTHQDCRERINPIYLGRFKNIPECCAHANSLYYLNGSTLLESFDLPGY